MQQEPKPTKGVAAMKETIRQMCALRHLVLEHVFKYEYPADCFCDQKNPNLEYYDTGVIAKFIRAAVVEKIADTKQRRRRRTVIVRPIPE